VGITPGGVHDQYTWILANGFGECLRSFFDNNVAPANLAWARGIECRTFWVVAVGKLGDFDILLETWLSLAGHQNVVM
jgi:hypothetical protein